MCGVHLFVLFACEASKIVANRIFASINTEFKIPLTLFVFTTVEASS